MALDILVDLHMGNMSLEHEASPGLEGEMWSFSANVSEFPSTGTGKELEKQSDLCFGEFSVTAQRKKIRTQQGSRTEGKGHHLRENC